MTKLEDNSKIYFEDESPCCFLEIKSIGSLNPSEMSKALSDFINERIGIQLDKIYISFEDVSASMWAWNGRTFG
jgi:phenylpyruvate tautomerase PptA (4-oxalocrotonate tautomerase family)